MTRAFAVGLALFAAATSAGVVVHVAGVPPPATGTVGEGGPATEAALNSADDVMVAPNGDIYLADYNSARLLRIREGILTVAYRGDFRAGENDFSAVAIASDGTVYFTTGAALLLLAPDGIVSEVLETDPESSQIFNPELAIGPDDTIYMAGGRIPRIDLVGRDGSTTLIAGADEPASEAGEGDGGQALGARFGRISSLAVDSTGAIYVADTDWGDVRLIGPDGIIETIFGAGSISINEAVDGTRAFDVDYGSAEIEVSLDAADRPFVVPRLAARVWMIDGGVITTVAGGGTNRGTGFPPLETQLQSPVRVAFTPEGDILILVEDGRYLYRVGGVSEAGLIDSVPGPEDINLDPLVVAASVALTAGMVFLIPFPAEIFNQTVATHYQEIRAVFRRREERGDGFWQSRWGLVVAMVLMALLYGFLDPSFGLNARALPTFFGLLVGVIAVTLGFVLPTRILRRARSGDWGRLRALPVALLVGVGCVILSRLVGFVPGYLYGVVLALVFSREAGEDAETNELTVDSIVLLAIAFSSWFGLGAVRASGGGSWSEFLEAALAMSTVAAFEGLVFGLLPIHGMPGRILFKRRRVMWAVIWGLALLAFFHVLVNPRSGYLVDTAAVPVLTTYGLLAFFGGLSFGLSLWFRRSARKT